MHMLPNSKNTLRQIKQK